MRLQASTAPRPLSSPSCALSAPMHLTTPPAHRGPRHLPVSPYISLYAPRAAPRSKEGEVVASCGRRVCCAAAVPQWNEASTCRLVHAGGCGVAACGKVRTRTTHTTLLLSSLTEIGCFECSSFWCFVFIVDDSIPACTHRTERVATECLRRERRGPRHVPGAGRGPGRPSYSLDDTPGLAP